MSKIKENMKVIVIGENNKIENGTVKTVYEKLGTAIVELDDGYIIKVRLIDLGIPETSEPVEDIKEEPKREPVEKSEITITPEEFRNIGVDVIKKQAKKNPMIVLPFTVFLAELHKALFFDAVEND